MSVNCERIHKIFNSMKTLSFPFDRNDIPANGIYVLFEKGEYAHSLNRIVRVGTHTGENNLASRLREHFVKENKDRSIFRKNIGRAILNKNHDPYLEKWEWDLTTMAAKEKYSKLVDADKQLCIEKTVTEYIQNNFTFIVFKVDDRETRLKLESRIISTVSLCNDCKPSNTWLGHFSTKEKIRESGLWLEQGLRKEPLEDEDIRFIEETNDNI